MWFQQEELLLVKKAFRFPCLLTNSSSFLSKLGKKLCIFCIFTYLHTRHQRPIGVSTLLSFEMNLTVTLSVKISLRSLAWSFCVRTVEGMVARWWFWSPSPFVLAINILYSRLIDINSYLRVIWWVVPTHISCHLIFFLRLIVLDNLGVTIILFRAFPFPGPMIRLKVVVRLIFRRWIFRRSLLRSLLFCWSFFGWCLFGSRFF